LFGALSNFAASCADLVTVVCRQTTNATVIMIATTTAANTLSMSDIGCYVAGRTTKTRDGILRRPREFNTPVLEAFFTTQKW
jgi:hypothetical protein